MLESGVEPNTITFTTVINACARVGDVKKAEAWLTKMKAAGILPNSFSYNSAAKPSVARGEYRRVEELMKSLRADGLPYDDFCLTSLLYAYSNAKPKQRERAEAVFREYVAESVRVTSTSLQALTRACGRAEAETICTQCGVDPAAVEITAGKGSNGRGRVEGGPRK